MPQTVRSRLNPKFLPLAATVSLFVAMAGAGLGASTPASSRAQVFLNLLIDNAFLLHRRGRHDLRDPLRRHRPLGGLGGGADHHGAGRAGASTRAGARRLAIPLVLLMGTAFGAFMGLLIQRFRLQPFIVTLAGMFLARGLCYLISIDSISITDEPFSELAQCAHAAVGRRLALARRGDRRRRAAGARSSSRTHTPFGRTVYAIGGNEHSAVLMGLPVRRTAGGRVHAQRASARRWPAWCSPSTCSRATACTPSAWSSTPSPPW